MAAERQTDHLSLLVAPASLAANPPHRALNLPSPAAEDFVARLADKLGRRGAASERACERRETDEQSDERLLREGLAAER